MMKLSLLLAALAALTFAFHVPAEEAPGGPVLRGTSFGIALHRFQDDLGAGVVVSTPPVLDEAVRLTAGGGIAWYPHDLDATGQQTWTPFGHGRLVLEGGAGFQASRCGCTAPVGSSCSCSLASRTLAVGGVGGFGFEFGSGHAASVPTSYFVELGATAIGARADRLPTKPFVANGFPISVGFRGAP